MKSVRTRKPFGSPCAACWKKVHPVRRQQRQRVPAFVPPLADPAAFQQDMVVPGPRQVMAEREASLAGADEDGFDVRRRGGAAPGLTGAACCRHVSTPTCTGTPFVTMSKTADRACLRARRAREAFSGGASPPSTTNEPCGSGRTRCGNLGRTGPRRAAVRRCHPRASTRQRVRLYARGPQPHRRATWSSRRRARAGGIRPGWGPVSVPMRIAGSPASSSNVSARDVSSPPAA